MKHSSVYASGQSPAYNLSMRHHRRIPRIAIALFALAIVLAPTRLLRADEPMVTARLVTDTSTVQAGRLFRVGVLFQIKPGWHIYWKNAGDMGLPTSIKFRLPEGFAVGELQWPVPAAFTQDSLTAYGYPDSVLLFAEAVAPQTIAEGTSIPIAADVDWMACQQACVPGSAKLATTLPSGTAAPANVELFTEWESRVPVRIDTKRSPATANVTGRLQAASTRPAKFSIDVDWQHPPAEVAVIPNVDPAVYLDDMHIQTHERKTTVTFNARLLPGIKLGDDSMEIVLAYNDGQGRRRGVSLRVALLSP
jgi:DsbC/DsbD-like thiol-disulfide interchange protein